MLVLVSLVLATVVAAADLALHRRAPCACPSFDTGFYPLGHGSGPHAGGLLCNYPALSRCQFSTADGSLIKDSDAGLCPPSASSGQTCPMTDAAGYALGPGSGVHGSILYCTYPTNSELNSQIFTCQYSQAGTLTTDLDDGFCPATAQCNGANPPVSTPPVIAPPTIASTAAVTTMTAVPTVPTFTALPSTNRPSFTTSSADSSASIAASNSNTNSGNSRSNKHVTAIAVGATIGGLVLLSAGFLAFVLIGRKKSAADKDIDYIAPPMAGAGFNQHMNAQNAANMPTGPNMPVGPNNWPPQAPYSPPPPSMLPNPYPSPPPQNPSPGFGQPIENWHPYGPPPQSMTPPYAPTTTPTNQSSIYSQAPLHPNVPEI